MMRATTDTPPVQDPFLNLAVLLRQIQRGRWWIIASVIISTVLFSAAAFMISPTYRAVTVFIPVSAERNNLAGSANSAIGQLGGLASLVGIGAGSGDPATAEALGVLRSRQFTDRFILEDNLMPMLFSTKWDAKAKAWKPDARPAPTIGRAFKYFDKSIRTVVQDNKTGLITLQIDWVDRNAAAFWANDLVKRLNAEMRARAISNADASIAFLERELPTTAVLETRESINRLIETQVKQRMLANVTEQYAFRVVDEATAPDSDDTVGPPKLLLLVAGPLVGLALSVGCVLMLLPGGDGLRAIAGSSSTA